MVRFEDGMSNQGSTTGFSCRITRMQGNPAFCFFIFDSNVLVITTQTSCWLVLYYWTWTNSLPRSLHFHIPCCQTSWTTSFTTPKRMKYIEGRQLAHRTLGKTSRGRNKPIVSRAIWAPGIKKMRAFKFCSPDLVFLISFFLYIRYWNEPTFFLCHLGP